MNYSILLRVLTIIIPAAVLFSCTAPRTILHSGKVTPHKHLSAGADMNANYATQTGSALYVGIEGIAWTLLSQDTVYYDEELKKLIKPLLAYSLDPISTGYDFYARYGIVPGLDAGYRYTIGTHVVDARWQFLGSTGTFRDPGEKGIHGSAGLQYSSRKYELPAWSGLDKVQDLLGFSLSRKDILLPVAFSYSFGAEEEIGSIAWGAVYSHTFLKYGFSPDNIFFRPASSAAPMLLEVAEQKKSFASGGIFGNLKLGYRYVYFLASLAVYYQNYGSFKILGDETIRLKGYTVAPSIGLLVSLPLAKPVSRNGD